MNTCDGFGFAVFSLESRFLGVGFGIQGVEFVVCGLWFGVCGLGMRIQVLGSEFRIQQKHALFYVYVNFQWWREKFACWSLLRAGVSDTLQVHHRQIATREKIPRGSVASSIPHFNVEIHIHAIIHC